MRRPKTRVEDLMTTAVLTLRVNDTVQDARDQMEMANIRHLPVVDEKGRVIGILSSRDLTRLRDGHKHVADVMHHPALTVHPDTPAYQAAAILRSEKIGSLPVVDPDDRLMGIVTETDFLAYAEEALGGRPAAEPA